MVNQSSSFSPPDVFKGIALFTPGGDLVYCIDPKKRNRWHSQLCATLQELLSLTASPHFLVPCYTATVDRWWDARTQTLHTVAEASCRVMRYEALLNAVFGLPQIRWSPLPRSDDLCDPELLDTYRTQFPALWNHHNLVVHFDPFGAGRSARSPESIETTVSNASSTENKTGFVLRLFISGHSASTELILRKLHYAMETTLQEPYALKVIDVHRNPEQAEIDQITATPTLLKVWPLPAKRIVGNLDNVEQFLSILVPRQN
ncbi:MAG: circadian clock protein KaiB [Merismopedia sp. SIO2A8]|nr:circadian clock protein KaiB [Symploca sp. SIO2B6]NET47626.1 circadian clock protein KaiB [Merismopedia sp. SIO2A8]